MNISKYGDTCCFNMHEILITAFENLEEYSADIDSIDISPHSYGFISINGILGDKIIVEIMNFLDCYETIYKKNKYIFANYLINYFLDIKKEITK